MSRVEISITSASATPAGAFSPSSSSSLFFTSSTAEQQRQLLVQQRKQHFQAHMMQQKEVSLPNSSNSLSMRAETEKRLESISLPSHWSTMKSDQQSQLVELDRKSHSAEYSNVELHFLTTAQGGVKSVTQIERIQNPVIYRRYELKKQQILDDASYRVDLRTYHGCRRSPADDPVKSIVDTGLDVKFGGGRIWSAILSSYSICNFCNRLGDEQSQLYQVFVIKCTPHAGEVQASGTTYAIANSDRVLPEYLITFSKNNE